MANEDRQDAASGDERMAPLIPTQESLRNVQKALLKEQFKIFLAQTQKLPLYIDLTWLFGGSVFGDEMVTWSQIKVSLGDSSIAVGPGERLQLWDPVYFFLGSLFSWNTLPPSAESWRIPAWTA